MVAIIPALEVPKPTEETPLRYGIFQAAVGPFDFPDIHMRGGGLKWLNTMCGGGDGYEIECLTALDVKDFFPGGVDTVTGIPFVVRSNFRCALSTDAAVPTAEMWARQKFFSVEQSQVEEIFSLGLFAQGPSLSGNPAVVNLDPSTAAATVTDVISVLERAVYCTSQYGPRAYLHVPFPVFNRMKQEHLIEFDGRRWRTAAGSVVSAGCYAAANPAGVAPAEGTFWVYATGQTVIYRTAASEVEQIPVQGALNRTTNQYTGLVEREYVVAFECTPYALPVTLWT